MSYTVCFDFPELTDPMFAGWARDVLGFAPSLRTAAMFETEEAAQRALDGYSANTREWGCVVEVDRVEA